MYVSGEYILVQYGRETYPADFIMFYIIKSIRTCLTYCRRYRACCLSFFYRERPTFYHIMLILIKKGVISMV